MCQMKKSLTNALLLFVVAILFSSCRVGILPHWYYYYGSKYTFTSSKYYNQYKHWKGGRELYQYYRQ